MNYKLLLCLFVVLLICCNRNESKFIGIWNIKTRMPYSAKLILNENHTFSYKGGACLSLFESNGNWKIVNDTLILKSKLPNECFHTSKFGYICYEIKDSLKIRNQTTIPNCKPKKTGYTFINFLDDKFVLKKDFLVYLIDKYDNCADDNNKFLISRK